MQFRTARVVALILLGLTVVQGIHLPGLHEDGFADCSHQCLSCAVPLSDESRLTAGCTCPPSCPGQADPCSRLACHLCQVLAQVVVADGPATVTPDALFGALSVVPAVCRPVAAREGRWARGPPCLA